MHRQLKVKPPKGTKTKSMKNERTQLEIIQNQIVKAMEIIFQQKKRYETLQSQLCGYNWTCEEDGYENEIARGLQEALGGLEQAYENIYNN